MTETKLISATEKEQKVVKTVVVLIFNGDKILTVRHKVGTIAGEGVYGLPGGKLRPEETEIEAAIRELREETGLETSAEDLIQFPGNKFNALLNIKGQMKPASMTVFICNNYKGELTEETGKTKPEWVDRKRFNLLYETLPNVLEAVENGRLARENF